MYLISRGFRNDSEIHIIARDFNGHVEKESVTSATYHGGKSCGTRNPKGLRILELCSSTDLAVSTTLFHKKQIDQILFS